MTRENVLPAIILWRQNCTSAFPNVEYVKIISAMAEKTKVSKFSKELEMPMCLL